MVSGFLKDEVVGIIIVLIVSIVLMLNFESIPPMITFLKVQSTFLRLNLFLEILVFSAFNIFVVFGIRGFFENFSRKSTNRIVLSTGIILFVVIINLIYQMLK